jgi:hypothetical protein
LVTLLNIASAMQVLTTHPEHGVLLKHLLALKHEQEQHQDVEMAVLDFLDYLLILGYSFNTEYTSQNGVTYLCCKPSST